TNVGGGKSNNDGNVVFEASQQRGWLDNILVRRFISPEPTVSIVPEGNTNINGTLCVAGDVIIVGLNGINISKSSDTYPAIVTKGNIYFNGTAVTDPYRPNIYGLIFADRNIDIDNLKINGSIYSGRFIKTRGNIDVRFETAANCNPFLNPPPYFYLSPSAVIYKKWLNLK
ncbi:MAG TPA: hypothetical protein PLM75_01750, partial [bacterium]|nr:hypothetical protein [bacterium]